MSYPPSPYLDLLERVLTNSIYPEAELRRVAPTTWYRRALLKSLARLDLTLVRKTPYRDLRQRYRGSPPYAHTMVSLERLRNIRCIVNTLEKEGIPGDLIETGVWRGGAIIFMTACLKDAGNSDRRVFAADSFSGLPRPNLDKYPLDSDIPWWTYPDAAVSVDQVKRNLSVYGLSDERTVFLKGWFKDTLPSAPVNQLAFMRLDGDMYESTMDALRCLYDKLAPGGFVVIDDYSLTACRRAVHDFLDTQAVFPELVPIDEDSVFWRKPTEAAPQD